MSKISVVGLSHRTAPVEVRERFATGADALPAVLARLSQRSELDESTMAMDEDRQVAVFVEPGDRLLERDAGFSVASELEENLAVERTSRLRLGMARHVFLDLSASEGVIAGPPKANSVSNYVALAKTSSVGAKIAPRKRPGPGK